MGTAGWFVGPQICSYDCVSGVLIVDWIQEANNRKQWHHCQCAAKAICGHFLYVKTRASKPHLGNHHGS